MTNFTRKSFSVAVSTQAKDQDEFARRWEETFKGVTVRAVSVIDENGVETPLEPCRLEDFVDENGNLLRPCSQCGQNRKLNREGWCLDCFSRVP